MAAFQVIIWPAHHEKTSEGDGKGAGVSNAYLGAELQKHAAQQRRCDQSRSIEIEAVQQHIQCRAQAFGTHDVMKDVRVKHVIGGHETAQHQPESQKKRQTHLERATVSRDRCSRRKMREESAQASCRPSGHQLMVVTSHSKPSTRSAIRRNEIAERHEAHKEQQALRLEVDVDLRRCPCHKQAQGNGSALNGSRGLGALGKDRW